MFAFLYIYSLYKMFARKDQHLETTHIESFYFDIVVYFISKGLQVHPSWIHVSQEEIL